MGRKAPILLLYFPTDDTIELRQLLPASTPETILSAEHSHLAYSTILKRQRVAKYGALLQLPLLVRVTGMPVLEPACVNPGLGMQANLSNISKAFLWRT